MDESSRGRDQDPPALPVEGAVLASVRAALFWIHFGIGVVVAAVVLTMASTGTIMAFEHEILAALDARHRITAPEGTAQLPPSRMLATVTPQLPPGTKPSALTVYAEPGAPALLAAKGSGYWLVDPYSGEILAESRARAFFALVEDVHRNLALARFDKSSVGKTVTGWTAVGVALLGVSGLYLWWPAKRGGPGCFRRVAFFRRTGNPAARDFNWHNVIGVWTAPVLVGIALTGTTISFDGVKKFVTTTFGVAASRPEPPPASAKFDLDEALAEAVRRVPEWTAVNVRWPARDGKLTLRIRTGHGTRPDQWSLLTYRVDNGAVASFSRYEEAKTGTKILGWARWLHTGQALGLPGQAVGAITAVGATVLAGTGLTMAWRRMRRTLFARRRGAKGTAQPSA